METVYDTPEHYPLPRREHYARPTHYAASPELRAVYAADCQSCGMCCVYYGEGPFRMPIAPEPYQQPPRKMIQVGPRTVMLGTNRFLRVKADKVWKGHNRCAALEGIQGKHVRCSVYSSRPFCCSDYDPGSADCLKVRKWAGLEPLDDGYGRS